jgi:hypothetical protein
MIKRRSGNPVGTMIVIVIVAKVVMGAANAVAKDVAIIAIAAMVVATAVVVIAVDEM